MLLRTTLAQEKLECLLALCQREKNICVERVYVFWLSVLLLVLGLSVSGLLASASHKQKFLFYDFRGSASKHLNCAVCKR
jgi:hypothetical protein